MEVAAVLRFTTPCLGSVRGDKLDTMLRDKDGRVIMLQSWFRAVFRYGSEALNKYLREAEQILVDPVVDGELGVFDRFYSAVSSKKHEAFLPGAEITIRCFLPNQLSVQQFHDILDVAGKYVGISPYRGSGDFGRFTVVDITPWNHGNNNNNSVGKSDIGPATNGGTANSSSTIC